MEYRNILLIKMSSLGDILHTLPFVAALRERFPEAKITWVVHPAFADLLPGPPFVDEVIPVRRLSGGPLSFWGNFLECRALARTLRSRHFDLVIDLQGLFKSALVAVLSGCRNRIGTAKMREGSALVARRIIGEHASGHALERSLDVARFLGAACDRLEFPLPDLTEARRSLRVRLSDAGLAENVPYAVLAPETRWKTKRWPTESFAELAARLTADGLGVVLAGGPSDRASGEAVAGVYRGLAALTPNIARRPLVDLTGETSLRELAALTQDARIFVSADTGPLHIAAAVGTPLVALYGPTRPGNTGPRGLGPMTVLVTPLDCGGCIKRSCRRHRCMAAISPETAHAACLKLLSR